jgi:nicotinate-nucleotide--dimethylbenzimidazole phosphoribosyltransferase
MSLFLDKNSLSQLDAAISASARARLDNLTKPQGSLGKLEDIAAWLCDWQQTLEPRTEKAYTLIFAGNHGVVAQGVSAFPSEVTVQMVANFENGGAAINQLCKAVSSTLRVIALSLDKPTKDFTKEAAMTLAECEEAFRAGMESVPQDAEILVIGEMGIGNTTVAAALAHALGGGVVADWVGAGTGIDEKAIAKKREVVAQAVALHKNNLGDTLEVLRCVGGRELAAMAGAIWQARKQRVPVILDGYVVTAAAATLTLTKKDALAHCLAGHLSVEAGHKKLLEFLDMKPLLDLGMRLGEGSGAQVALAVVRCAVATFTGMATFEEAMVAGKKQ